MKAKPVTLRKGMLLLIDPGDGAVMLRQLVSVRVTPEGADLVLTEQKGYPSERRWAKSKRPEHHQ